MASDALERKFGILTLDAISPRGLLRFPPERYQVGDTIAQPDAILLRSHDLHNMSIPSSLLAVARAGAGVNNIPIAKLDELGVAVFNTPGANANAVKELVIAAMLVAARNLCAAWKYAAALSDDEGTIVRRVEQEKKRFSGFELANKTLGVVGLGAVGVKVANAAAELGMEVIGYDPAITVERAWQLSSRVRQAGGLEEVLRAPDFLSLHVPLLESTRQLMDAKRIALLKQGSVLLNFSRPEVVDAKAVSTALQANRLHAYVSDFPLPELQGQPKAITFPHLGASTVEAEENCAIMAAEQLRDYLENGNVRQSVNFPDIRLERSGVSRLAVINRNVPDRLGRISHYLGQAGVNILHLVNESKGNLACTLVDVDAPIDTTVVDTIAAIEGVLRVRVL